MQAIMWDRSGNRVLAASDPRGGGKAEVRSLTTQPAVRLRF
jgi:hypothetical protein